MNEIEIKQFIADRRIEGSKLNPETAEMMWIHSNVVDPYRLRPYEEGDCVGREYFARDMGSDNWIHQADVPDEIWAQIWDRHKALYPRRPALFDDDVSF